MSTMSKTLLLLIGILALPYLCSAQFVTINFQVDMNYQLQLGNFSATDPIDLAGSFNGWGNTQHRLLDEDGDGIYNVVVGGFTVGEAIEFKFRRNGSWDGTEEFPNGGSNRTYTIQNGENNILVWYNNEAPSNAAPIADIKVSHSVIRSQGVIFFEDASSGEVDDWVWLFEGGQPSTASSQNVKVRYSQAGSYDVQLVVSNPSGRDTLTLKDYIKVKERNEEEIEWWNDAVFYEIFVRSFYDGDNDGIGDFEGLIEKLDYLNDGDPNTDDDLGITGIWLMPIHPAPSYHGYDVQDYRAIHPDYGTMEDFKAFLKAAHDRGIRVIIDYVMNHTSSAHSWFLDASAGVSASKRNWYRWSSSNPNYNGPWGQQVWHQASSGYYYGLFWGGMPDLNYEESDVKSEMFDIADYWLDEIGVDGFRLDAVKFIDEDGQQMEDTPATFQFWKDFRAHYKATQPDAFTVGEAWTNTNTILKYVEDGGLDFCFEFDLANDIVWAVNNGYAAGLSNKLEAIYSIYPNMQYGTFLSNHDQNRVIESLGFNRNKMKAAAAIYLTAPGVPFIYYGEEIGMKGVKPDEFIRTPMQWTDGVSAGFTQGSPWIGLNNDFRTNNVATAKNDPNSLLNWYDQLIDIRNKESALRRGKLIALTTNDNAVLAFMRSYEQENILVLVNTSSLNRSGISLNFSDTTIPSTVHPVVDLLSNVSSTLEINSNYQVEGINLSGYQTAIYKFDKATAIEKIEPDRTFLMYPNPSATHLTIEHQLDESRVHFQVIDTKGKIVQTGSFSDNYYELDSSQLAVGIYLIQCEVKGTIQTYKFVKQ